MGEMANPKQIVTLNISYENKTFCIECPREKILSKLRKELKLNEDRDILLHQKDTWSDKWTVVDPLKLTNKTITRVQTVDVSAGTSKNRSGNKRTLQTVDEDALYNKLENQEDLSQKEREFLIHLLRNNPSMQSREQEVQTERESTLDIFDTMMWLKKAWYRREHKMPLMKEDVDYAMEMTYRERRNFVLSDCPNALAMKQLYPILFDTDEAISEFCRIANKDVAAEFTEKLEKHSASILMKMPGTVPCVEIYCELIDDAGDEDEESYITYTGALLSLPTFLKEDLSDIIRFETEGAVDIERPIIIFKDDMQKCFRKKDDSLFQIYVEKLKLCETNDFVRAVLALLAAYYIFYIVYPPNCCQTLTLLQTIFLGIPADESEKGLTETVKKYQKLWLKK